MKVTFIKCDRCLQRISIPQIHISMNAICFCVLILVNILHNLVATSVSQSVLQLNLVSASYIVNVMYYRVTRYIKLYGIPISLYMCEVYMHYEDLRSLTAFCPCTSAVQKFLIRT